LAVFHASPRRDSRSLLIICVITRKRTARMIGDHKGRDADTTTVLLTTLAGIPGTHRPARKIGLRHLEFPNHGGGL
jgi:hypothetical protein